MRLYKILFASLFCVLVQTGSVFCSQAQAKKRAQNLVSAKRTSSVARNRNAAQVAAAKNRQKMSARRTSSAVRSVRPTRVRAGAARASKKVGERPGVTRVGAKVQRATPQVAATRSRQSVRSRRQASAEKPQSMVVQSPVSSVKTKDQSGVPVDMAAKVAAIRKINVGGLHSGLRPLYSNVQSGPGALEILWRMGKDKGIGMLLASMGLVGGTVSGGIGLVGGFVVDSIFAHYRNKDISKQAAIDAVKNSISMQLADSLTYPTRSTKVHALMKQNEFLLPGIHDVDGILAQACSDLMKEFSADEEKRSAVRRSDEEKRIEAEIDKKMSELRKKYGTSSLDDQIAAVQVGLEPLFDVFSDTEMRARLAMLRRLDRQALVEQRASGTFEKTSAAKFYAPMTESELAGVQQRKKMTDEEWEAYKKQRQKSIADKLIEATSIKSKD